MTTKTIKFILSV